MHQGEQERAARGICLDQAADVDVALGDDAVERRDHALIGFLLVQDPQLRLLCRDIRLRDGDRGLARLETQAIGIALLLRDPTLMDERLVAIPGDLGEIAIGFRLLQRCLQLRERPLGLRNLMLKLGGRDLDK